MVGSCRASCHVLAEGLPCQLPAECPKQQLCDGQLVFVHQSVQVCSRGSCLMLVGWWTMLDAVVGDALLVRWQPCSQALATAWMTRPVA